MNTLDRNALAKDHTHARRTGLLAVIKNALDSGDPVLLAAPAGYGKTTLMQDMVKELRTSGSLNGGVVFVDCDSDESRAFVDSYEALRGKGMTVSRACAGSRKAALGSLHTIQTIANKVTIGTQSLLSARAMSSGPAEAIRHSSPARAGLPDEPLSALIWTLLEEWSYGWAHQLLATAAGSRAAADNTPPLIVIDNLLTFSSEERLAQFGRTLRRLVEAGARLMIACTPSSDVLNAELPRAVRIDGEMLVVDEGEFGLWCRDLCLPIENELLSHTLGVPALLDACRYMMPGEEIWECGQFLERVESVIRAGLRETKTMSAEKIMEAILLLGVGSLGNLAEMGLEVRSDDLALMAHSYPHLGIDLNTGSFHCPPLAVHGHEQIYAGIVGSDPAVAFGCVRMLIETGREIRAAQVARLLPDSALLNVATECPYEIANASLDDMTMRVLKYVDGLKGVSEEAQRRIADLDEIRAVMFGQKRVLELGLGEYGERHDGDALDAIHLVATAWSYQEGVRDNRRHPGEEEEGPLRHAGSLLIGASASVDTPLAEEAEGRLRLLSNGMSRLGKSLVIHHIAICRMMRCDFDGALGEIRTRGDIRVWEPWDGDGRDTLPISDMILTADVAFAKLMVETPASCGDSDELFERIRGVRQILERRGLLAFLPCAYVQEAMAAVFCGKCLDATTPLENSLRMFVSRGDMYGQMACHVARSLVDFMRGSLGRAENAALAAMRTADNLRCGFWGDLAQMVYTAASGLRDDAPESFSISGREVTFQNEGGASPWFGRLIERAFTRLFEGHAEDARSDIRNAIANGGSVAKRVLCVMAYGASARKPALCSPIIPLFDEEYRRFAEACGSTPALAVGSFDLDVPLRVYAFQSLRIELNGHDLGDTAWGRRKSKQLLAFLAIAPNQRMSRVQLISLLWPHTDPLMQRGNLSATLTTLRKALGQSSKGPYYILANNEAIQLNPELVQVDVGWVERMARYVVSSRHSLRANETMSICEDMEGVYGRGLDVREFNLGSYGRQRLSELTALFVDCMVLAGGLSVECGDMARARGFARAASRLQGSREDVRHLMGLLGDGTKEARGSKRGKARVSAATEIPVSDESAPQESNACDLREDESACEEAKIAKADSQLGETLDVSQDGAA